MSLSAQERSKQAYQLNTTPEYVTYDSKHDFWHNLEYEISTNFNFGDRLVHPLAFVDRVQSDPRFPLQLTVEQLCVFYVYANPVVHAFLMGFVEESPETAIWQLNQVLGNTLDEQFQGILTQYWSILQEYVQLYDLREGMQRCLSEQIEPGKIAFRKRYQEDMLIEQELAQYAVPVGDFTVKSLNRTYALTATALAQIRNINQLFDRSVVSAQVPLIVTHDVHKVLKGHTYALQPLPRNTSVTESLFLWTYFGRVEVQLRLDHTKGIVTYSLKEADEVDAEQHLRVICASLGLAGDEMQLTKSSFNGEIPIRLGGIAFSVDLWRDMLVNDSRVTRFLVIDETQLTREREGELDEVEFEGFDSEAGSRLPHLFLPEERAFHIDVQEDRLLLQFTKVDSLETVGWIAQRVSQALGRYAHERRNLLEVYRQYTDQLILLPSTLPVSTVSQRRQKPAIYKIFGSNFSRAVGSKVPSLLTEDEARRVRDNGFQVLEFPKAQDIPPGESAMYFSCHARTDGYVYPGLLLNPIPGGKYPLLPCCYKEDQWPKKNSNTVEYYQSEPALTFADFRGRQKDRSFVSVDAMDACPDLLADLYLLNGFVAPGRRGVHRSPLSALECVLYALDINGFRKLTPGLRLQRVEEERLRMLRDFPYYMELCAQETWDQVAFPNADEYFDPRKWIRLLEVAYKCCIVMFDPNDFVFPRHVQGRWIWTPKPDVPVVVLYEHYGATTAARASYPQCEWITFPSLDPMMPEHRFVANYAIEASGSVQRMIDTYAMFQELNASNFTIESQHIDFYGKVYAWNIVRGRERYTLFFRRVRLPPLHLPRATDIAFGRPAEYPTDFFSVGEYHVRVYAQPFHDSLRETYDFIHLQVKLLSEQAKWIYAQRLEAGDAADDWSFIRVNADMAYRPRNRFYFDSSRVVYVPNTLTKERLEYFLAMYGRRKESELREYLTATTVPFSYRTIAEFQSQDNAVVMANQRTIQWNEMNYATRSISEVDGSVPFFIRVKEPDGIVRCVSMEDMNALPTNYRLFVPQQRKTLVVGSSSTANALPEFLVIQSPNAQGDWSFYQCTRIN